MKRVLALILALVMTVTLVACGGDKPGSAPDADKPSAPSEPSKPAEPSKPTEPSKPAEPEKPADPDAWKYGGDLVIGSGNAVVSMDPGVGSQIGDTYWMMHVYENLAVLDDSGKMFGQVCDFEESEDGLTMKFTLRERYFSNGDKITMDDVVASVQRAAAIQTGAEWDKLWKDATLTVDGDVLTIRLATLNLNFHPVFGKANGWYKVMPKEVCEKYPVTGAEMQANGLPKGGIIEKQIDKVEDIIGSGPYMLSEWSDSKVMLVRNENYQGIENEGATGVAAYNHAYLDSITWSVNLDSGSRTAAMLAGEYSVGSVSAAMVETAKSMGIKSYSTGTSWTHAIFFNLHESNADSPVANVNVRKAIRAAIDCNAVMLSILGGDQSRVNLDPYPITNAVTAYASTVMEDSGEWNVANQELAREYLKKANYNGEEIVYLTHASGNYYNAAMAVIPQLEAVGMKITLMAVDNGSHTAMRKDPATGHDIGGWETQKREDNPVMQSTLVNGTVGWWSSDARNNAIATMKTTPTGSPESVKAYQDFMQAVVDECPYIAFGYPTGIGYTQDNVCIDFIGQKTYYWNSYFTDHKK